MMMRLINLILGMLRKGSPAVDNEYKTTNQPAGPAARRGEAGALGQNN